MKQSVQARLTVAQIQAIRHKRQQGWSPRQIEEDTGIDHVTVWRHTRNIKPIKGEAAKGAMYKEPDPIIAPPAPVHTSPTTFSNASFQMNSVAQQYTPLSNPSQFALVQTPVLSPQHKPRIGEYVVEEVDRKERKGWDDRLWDEEQRYLVHRVKMAIRESQLAEANQRLARSRYDLRQVENRTRPERPEPDNERGIQASDILAFLTGLVAERVRNGMDPGEAARRFGEDIDTCLLLALASRRPPEN